MRSIKSLFQRKPSVSEPEPQPLEEGSPPSLLYTTLLDEDKDDLRALAEHGQKKVLTSKQVTRMKKAFERQMSNDLMRETVNNPKKIERTLEARRQGTSGTARYLTALG